MRPLRIVLVSLGILVALPAAVLGWRLTSSANAQPIAWAIRPIAPISIASTTTEPPFRLAAAAAVPAVPTPPTPPAPVKPTVTFETKVRQNPPEVINIAHVPAGAAVNIKAITASSITGSKLALPSQIAHATGAILVINGDFFDSNRLPIGKVVANGRQLWSPSSSSSHSQLSLSATRNFSCDDHGGVPAGSVQSLGAMYCLLQNGAMVNIAERDGFTTGLHARTLVGWNRSTGEIWFVTVDQAGKSSIGMTLAQATQLMKGLGATDAVNEDGGSSSQFVANGFLLNHPSLGAKPVNTFWAIVPT